MAAGGRGQAVLLGYPDEYMAGDREHHTTNKVQYSTVQYSTGSTTPLTRCGLASLLAADAATAMLQVGGLPDWPDTLAADTAAPRCAECGQEQVLVAQVAAPLAHLPPACARTLYLFCCLQPACWTRPGR